MVARHFYTLFILTLMLFKTVLSKSNKMKRELDICILSEVQLGTLYCKPLELLKYLKSIKPAFLIVNGNFIDKNQYRRKYFSKKHLLVIHQVMKMALDGCKVILVTGGDDDFLKRFSGLNLGNIHLRREMVLKLKGEEYFIVPEPAESGRKGVTAGLNRIAHRLTSNINKIAGIFPRFGRSAVNSNLSLFRKKNPSAEEVSTFSRNSAKYAIKKGYKAIICGKIRSPEIAEIAVGKEKVKYLNPGDWLQHLSALEYSHGNWEIYRYDELDFGLPNRKLRVREQSPREEEDVFIVRKPIASELKE
ncbi:MAG: hypothetical protein EA411_09415 [Saprospirales bacterium]|nr:MAG: hypothetical protein EA411_09415 [Saprospirales bacterium]